MMIASKLKNHFSSSNRTCPGIDFKCDFCGKPKINENSKLVTVFLPYVCTSLIPWLKLKDPLQCSHCKNDFFNKGILIFC